jgi:hypothetical protein
MILGMPAPAFPTGHLRLAAGRVALLAVAILVAGCGVFRSAPPAVHARHVEPTPDDTALPAGAAATLRQRFPWMHAIAHGLGRLQVDDVDDLAVVLAPAGQSHDVVVALLVNTGPADYRVVAVSQVIEAGCPYCSASVDIARHSLFVRVRRDGDPDYESIAYQFAYRDNGDVLRLVGVSARQPAQADDPIAHSYASTTNLLTGSKVDVIDDAPNDASRRRELRSTVALRPPIAFAAFSFAADALDAETRKPPASGFEPAEPLPAAVATLLRTRFPGLVVLSRASGALRAKGSRDVAAVLAPASRGDTGAQAGEPAVIAVVLGQPDGSVKLGAVSGPVTRNCAACDVQVEIGRQSLVVQTSAADATGSRIRGYQFAWPGSKDAASRASAPLRLVGVRTVTVTRSRSGDSRRYVNTANLATGDKLDVIEDVVQGNRTRVKRASQVPLRPPIPFASFAFDTAKLDAETRQDFVPR